MPKTMLQSEQNTQAVKLRVSRLAKAKCKGHERINPHFEHGHWWVLCGACDKVWSVVDAEGPGTIEGMDLEEISAGDESCQ